MPHSMVAGFPVWQMQMGNGANRALLIHCSLSHSGAWAQMMARLNDVISATAFDLPGHGRSGDWDRRGGYQTVTAEIAAALIDAPVTDTGLTNSALTGSSLVSSGPVDIIGHSFGATVALRLAVERPDLVRSLILIEPVYFAVTRGTPAFAKYRRAEAAFAGAIMAGDKMAATRAFTSVWGAGRSWESLSDAERGYLTDRIELITEIAPEIEDDASGIVAPGRLEEVNVPVLLVGGEESPPIMGAILSGLEARLPQCARTMIEGAGHMAPVTHPIPVAQAIAAHLTSI